MELIQNSTFKIYNFPDLQAWAEFSKTQVLDKLLLLKIVPSTEMNHFWASINIVSAPLRQKE
jgi:hypothetical protein